MSQATAARQVDVQSLSWPATQTWDGTQATIEAPDAPDDATLQAEVDAAPDAGWRDTNEDTIEARADQALSDLRTVRDSTGELSNAQLSDAVRLFARVLIAIVRLAIRKLDSTG